MKWKLFERLVMKRKRIVIDTNLWISFLISKKATPIEFLLLSQNFKVLFSKRLFEEFVTVSSREKFRNYFPVEDILNLSQLLYKYTYFITIATHTTLCRDDKDDFLLDLAIDGKADYLITGDKDLLILKQIENTKILTYANFISEVEII